jgi:hypothetical protein
VTDDVETFISRWENSGAAERAKGMPEAVARLQQWLAWT